MYSDFSRPADELRREASEYAELKIDELKLRTTKGLAVTLNHVLLAVLFLSIVNIVLMCFAFGLVLLLGEIVGSFTIGAFITGGIFILLIGILYLFRKKLFLSSLIRMFTQLFFDEEV